MTLFLQPTLSSIAAGKQSLRTPMSASSRWTTVPACPPTLLLPWLSFSSQPCHPSLPASSLCGPRCPPPADGQLCQPVLRHSFCHDSLSPANPVIHRCRQAVSADPGVHLQQMDNCASLSSDTPFAMTLFLQPTLSSIAAGKQSLRTPVSVSSRWTNVPACPPTLLLP